MVHSHSAVLPLRINKRFYFGGGGTPSVQQPPAPTPSPVPMTQNPVATATDRSATLKRLQYGLSSTVQGGMTATGANLKPAPVAGTGTAATSGGV